MLTSLCRMERGVEGEEGASEVGSCGKARAPAEVWEEDDTIYDVK